MKIGDGATKCLLAILQSQNKAISSSGSVVLLNARLICYPPFMQQTNKLLLRISPVPSTILDSGVGAEYIKKRNQLWSIYHNGQNGIK